MKKTIDGVEYTVIDTGDMEVYYCPNCKYGIKDNGRRCNTCKGKGKVTKKVYDNLKRP